MNIPQYHGHLIDWITINNVVTMDVVMLAIAYLIYRLGRKMK